MKTLCIFQKQGTEILPASRLLKGAGDGMRAEQAGRKINKQLSLSFSYYSIKSTQKYSSRRHHPLSSHTCLNKYPCSTLGLWRALCSILVNSCNLKWASRRRQGPPVSSMETCAALLLWGSKLPSRTAVLQARRHGSHQSLHHSGGSLQKHFPWLAGKGREEKGQATFCFSRDLNT